jgi:hypothetical protein
MSTDTITFSGEISAAGYTLTVNGEKFTHQRSRLAPSRIDLGDFYFARVEGRLHFDIVHALISGMSLLASGCAPSLWISPEQCPLAMLEDITVRVLETIAGDEADGQRIDGAKFVRVKRILQQAAIRLPVTELNLRVQRGGSSVNLRGNLTELLTVIIEEHENKITFGEFVLLNLRTPPAQGVGFVRGRVPTIAVEQAVERFLTKVQQWAVLQSSGTAAVEKFEDPPPQSKRAKNVADNFHAADPNTAGANPQPETEAAE